MHYLVILSGPGGSGKDTVMKALLKDPQFKLQKLLSHTSRPARKDEQHGTHYYFVPKLQYEQKINNNEMLEYEIQASNQHYYGTEREQLLRDLEISNLICNKMPVGALALKKHFGDQVITIFLDADNSELERRLFDPMRVGEHALIQRRLSQAATERQFKSQYDFSITNHDGQLDHTISQIKNYLSSRFSP